MQFSFNEIKFRKFTLSEKNSMTSGHLLSFDTLVCGDNYTTLGGKNSEHTVMSLNAKKNRTLSLNFGKLYL